MNIEIVTPAGRKRYLEILYKHLKSQKNDFNKWTLWINTYNPEDVSYCRELAKENEWIQTIEATVVPNGGITIYQFFKYACDPDSIYIRLDDDVIWIEKNFIKNLANFRINNPEYFLVYPNIINNAVIDHLNQRSGALTINNLIDYGCLDQNGWANSQIAEQKHNNFINSIHSSDIKKFKFKKWILNRHERVSINCISWLGSEFKKFDGKVGHFEEQWLSMDAPKIFNKFNVIYGKTLCSHYAFCTQRDYLDNQTDILNKYRDLTTTF